MCYLRTCCILNLVLAITCSQINANYLSHHQMTRKSCCRPFSEDYVRTSIWSDIGSHVPHCPRFLRRKRNPFIALYLFTLKNTNFFSSSTPIPSNWISKTVKWPSTETVRVMNHCHTEDEERQHRKSNSAPAGSHHWTECTLGNTLLSIFIVSK